MRTNIGTAIHERTHEGAIAKRITPEQELIRSVMCCLLWEDSFYESGKLIADRIKDLIPKCKPVRVAAIAVKARDEMKLRHVPLLIVREMARYTEHKKFVENTLKHIIQRPDELAEFLSIYWKEGRTSIAGCVKRGLAKAFTKFNRYQLAKYNRDGPIKLRDVLFLCHAKPKNEEQAKDWKDLISAELEPPDTWEVALSGGADKKESFERLIKEKKLGAMALLRNLRKMTEVQVSPDIIRKALKEIKADKVLPFRFITAGRYVPQFEPELESLMLKCLEGEEKLPGRTCLLIDVSGSMDYNLSAKAETTRMDAACGLAVLLREICEQVGILTFSVSLVVVPPRRGFALSDAIKKSQPHSGTHLGGALQRIAQMPEKFDRLIVITDEQSADQVSGGIAEKSYLINVGTYKNGVGYGPKWTHIDGWSEAVVTFIRTLEKESV